MKHISNEQKAKEIANDNCTHICLADCSAESYFSSENDCYKAAMEAMEWKDEQHNQEKRKWIENACEWLGGCTKEVVVLKFKKAMEEL